MPLVSRDPVAAEFLWALKARFGAVRQNLRVHTDAKPHWSTVG